MEAINKQHRFLRLEASDIHYTMKHFGNIRALDNSDDQPEGEGTGGDHDDRGLSDDNDEVAGDSDEEDDDELIDTNGEH
jgi:hypothetical protein